MKPPTTRAPKGFTIVEMVIVIGLLLIIASLLFTGFRDYTAYQQYSQALNDLKLVLQDSQTAARLSINGQAHGVKIETNQVTQFVGSTYNAGDPDNEVTTFDIVILTPNLTGGTDEIIFSRLNGHPSATGTIVVDGISYSQTDAVTVSAGGVVQ